MADALECLALRSWIPGRLELATPWGIQVVTRWGWFYLITGKPCLVEVEGGGTPVLVGAGDLIVVFQGVGHHLRDKADSPTTPIQDLLEPRHSDRGRRPVHGGRGASTFLFCGCFFLDDLKRSPLHAVLPASIDVQVKAGQPLPYVDHILGLVAQEAASGEPSSQIIINRLVRVLLMKVIQGCLSRSPAGGATWLKALVDDDVGPVLELMHAHPDVPWTVGSLAERVALSRSAFSARFTALVGKPPLKYLTEWRMQKACVLLRTTRLGLKEVAVRVGYESAAAFSKAFTRWAGATPSAYCGRSCAAPPWDYPRVPPT